MLPVRDSELVQIVDAALASASARARKADGSSWLACRPGCTPCCHGVFKITMLDAERLRSALRSLQEQNPATASEIRGRAQNFVVAFSSAFPGDLASGLLKDDEDAWDAFANLPATDVPCPALNPVHGHCELYNGRPLTCRIFGPPVVGEHGVGVCELCYVDADQETALAGQMHLTHGALEVELDEQMPPGETIIAWALAHAIVQAS